jgi:hypothetical protein
MVIEGLSPQIDILAQFTTTLIVAMVESDLESRDSFQKGEGSVVEGGSCPDAKGVIMASLVQEELEQL